MDHFKILCAAMLIALFAAGSPTTAAADSEAYHSCVNRGGSWINDQCQKDPPAEPNILGPVAKGVLVLLALGLFASVNN